MIQIALVAFLFIFVLPQEPTTMPATTQPQYGTLLRQVPRTLEEVQARIQVVEERIARFATTTQPTTVPADEAAAGLLKAQQDLYNVWVAYLRELKHSVDLLSNLNRISSETNAEAIAQEFARLDAALREVRELPRPVTATAEEVQQARSRVAELEARISALSEAQARRTAQLAGGFAQQREQLQNSLKDLRRQADPQPAGGEGAAPATAPAEKEREQVRRWQLNLQSAIAESALHNSQLEQQITELRQAQDERLLGELRKLLAAWQRRLAALVEAQGRDRVETLKLQREAATRPVERTQLELELFIERVLLKYFRSAERQAAQRPTVRSSADRVNELLVQTDDFWKRVADKLQYRSGAEIVDLQQRVQQDLREFRQRLARQQQRHATLLTELHELRTIRDQALRRFAELADKLAGELRNADPAERTRMEARVLTLRNEFVATMDASISRMAESIERTEVLLEGLEGLLEMLSARQRELYWTRVGQRASGLLKTDWAAAVNELRGLLGMEADPLAAAEDADLLELQRDLFGTRATVRGRAEDAVRAVRAEFAKMSARSWGLTGGAVLLAVVIGVGLHFAARRRSIPLAQRLEGEFLRPPEADQGVTAGLSGRIDLLGWNLVGDLATPLLMVAAVVIAVSQYVNDAAVQRLVYVAAGMPAAGVVAWRLVHHLFEADSPAHRPLPCVDSVARHYRWWLETLIVFSLALLYVPVLLDVWGLAPALLSALIEVGKTGLLLLVLAFLLPRQRVLGLFGAPGQHWGYTVAAMCYPVLLLGVVALLALELIGYGAQVTYIGRGVVLTAAGLLLAGVISEYVVDWLDHVMTRHAAAISEGGDDGAPGGAESGPHFFIVLIKTFVRLALLVGALLVFAWVWNLEIKREWLNWRLLGLSGLVIAVAMVVDRVILAAFGALVRSDRLPESAAGLFRRWIRGILAAIAVLTIASIWQWQGTERVWTFLTGVLAMIAIGFVAVWSILSNILATLVILIWRPFNVGEHVEIMPEALGGQVIDINFMFTLLKTEDNQRIAVPNNLFIQKFTKRRVLRGVPTRSLAEQLEEEKPLGE